MPDEPDDTQADLTDGAASAEPPKSRRGTVEKKKKGEAAEFKAGGAKAPRVFDAAKIAEAMNVWWTTEGGDSFWVCDEHGWGKWPKDALLDLMLQSTHRVAKKRRDGEFSSEASRFLVYVRTHRRVEGVIGGLAGHKSGVHRMPSGEKIIVRSSPNPVEPKAGDWSLVKELIEGRLDLFRDAETTAADNDGISAEEQQAAMRAARPVDDQVLYFHAWHQSVLRSLLHGKPGSWSQRRALALCGPAGCGKSRLQVNITNGLLGGRMANPKNFLTGGDNFNGDMVMAEHQMMEELDNVSQKMVDRLAFSEAMKAMVANTGARVRLMRTDPTTVLPFWAITLSMNNDPDKLRSFPPLTPDFRDKVHMLLVRRAPLPLPTRTDDEKERFNAEIAAQLPAYAHWLLNDFVVPEALLVDADGQDATRFGCRAYHHATLAHELFDDSPAAELLQLLDAAHFGAMPSTKLWDLKSDAKMDDDIWQGSAIELERLLMGEVPDWPSSVAREAKRLFVHNKCDRLLGRLEQDRPDRIVAKRTSIKRGWIVFPPK